MNIRAKQQNMTRTAILDALAHEIVESGAIGFSVQDVADRAEVTHRTVYNHFPTREALNDGLAVHVEQELGKVGEWPKITSVAGLEEVFESFRKFDQREKHVRAYVMLMIASRGPAKVSRARTAEFQEVIEKESGTLPDGVGRLVTAAVRTFGSSIGWHLLTEHLGLTTDEAIRTSKWAVRTMLAAVANGDVPKGDPDE